MVDTIDVINAIIAATVANKLVVVSGAGKKNKLIIINFKITIRTIITQRMYIPI